MESQIGERKRARSDNRSHSKTKTPDGTEQEPASFRRRRGGRFQKNSRSAGQVSSPSLGEYFSPELMSKFSVSASSDNGENQEPDRNVEESPFRSPLHKSRRGMQETSPRRGRRGPHHVGSHSSGKRATRVRTPHETGTSVGEGENDQENDRRVRKCLWAEEEDEAFCEGDDLSEEPVVAREPPKTPTKEQLARRQKDIDYGKATEGYMNYVEKVPRDQRDPKFPETPDKNEKVARRVWDITVRRWRRSLHRWDQPSKDDAASCSSNQSRPASRTASCSEGGEGPTPSNSVASSPSDKGYVTTPDSRADCSLLDLEEEEDDWCAGMEDFPPLPSSGRKKLWCDMVEEEEKIKEEHLDECVKNLSIGNVDKVHSKEGSEDMEQGVEVDVETDDTERGDQVRD